MKQILFIKTNLAVLALAAAACGEIKVSDSTHTVRHEIALDQLHAEIISLCHDAYTDQVSEQQCIQDTLQSIIIALQNGGVK